MARVATAIHAAKIEAAAGNSVSGSRSTGSAVASQKNSPMITAPAIQFAMPIHRRRMEHPGVKWIESPMVTTDPSSSATRSTPGRGSVCESVISGSAQTTSAVTAKTTLTDSATIERLSTRARFRVRTLSSSSFSLCGEFETRGGSPSTVEEPYNRNSSIVSIPGHGVRLFVAQVSGLAPCGEGVFARVPS